MTLYEINENIRQIIETGFSVDEETGEIKFEEKDLEMLAIARDEKVENLGLFIKELNAEAEAIKQEKMNLEKRQRAALKKADRLKDYLEAMLNGDKFKTARLSISYRTSESLEVKDISKVPQEYLRYSDPEVNKTDLKKAIKNGEVIEGVELISKTNIQIK